MHAKIFTSGNSQAVRLPKEVAFPPGINEVVVEKTPTGALLLKPFTPFDWDEFFEEAASAPMDIAIPDDDKPDPKRQQAVTQRLNTGLEE